MNINLPFEINKLLRRYALDNDLGSREKATEYILKKELFTFYKVEIKEAK